MKIFVSYSYIGIEDKNQYSGFDSCVINSDDFLFDEYTLKENIEHCIRGHSKENMNFDSFSCSVLFYDFKYAERERNIGCYWDY